MILHQVLRLFAEHESLRLFPVGEDEPGDRIMVFVQRRLALEQLVEVLVVLLADEVLHVRESPLVTAALRCSKNREGLTTE